MGQGITAAIENAATAAVAAAPSHRSMASVGGLLGGVAWGRLQGRICFVLGPRRSFLVRLLRTVDAATGGRTFGGWYVRLCFLICVQL